MATTARAWSTCKACGTHEYNDNFQLCSCRCTKCSRQAKLYKAKPPNEKPPNVVDASAGQATVQGLLAQAAAITSDPKLNQVLEEQVGKQAHVEREPTR